MDGKAVHNLSGTWGLIYFIVFNLQDSLDPRFGQE